MKLNSCLWVAVIVLLASGVWLQPLAAQDSRLTKWTTTGNLLNARVGHTATLLPNGRVLIVGGYGGSDELASAELYDPGKGVFIDAAYLDSGRTNHTATLLANGQVLVVGGQYHGNTLTSAVLYNPVTGVWTNTGSLHVSRSYHTATLLSNGQVLVVGGTHWASPPAFSQGAPPGSALDIAELYDPASGKWTIADSLHTARYVHTATLLRNGQVLVTGGLGPNGGDDVLASAELYTPTTKTWTGTGSLLTSLFNHTATLLPNGQMLVVGGQCHDIHLAGAELYNPSSGTWTQTGNLHAVRSGHNATLLPNGQVLVAGGGNDTSVLSNVELYDPSAGTWETTADLNTARSLHTATLLPYGQVLVTGGGNGDGTPSGVLANAELYNCVTKSTPETTPPTPKSPVISPPPSLQTD